MSAGKIDHIFFSFILLVLIWGCGSGGGDTPGMDPICEDLSTNTMTVSAFDYTFSYNTILLEADDFHHMIVDLENNVITLYPSSPLWDTIRQHDILMTGISSSFPQGLFKQITKISIYQDTMELETVDAVLEDAFKYLSLKMHKKLTFSDSTPQYLYPGVTMLGGDDQFSLAIDSVIMGHDGVLSTTDDQIRVEGNLTLTPAFDLELNIDLWNLHALDFNPNLHQAGQLTFSSGSAREIQETTLLASFKLKPFAIGPLVMAPEVLIVLDVDGKVSTEAKIGMEFEHDFNQLLKYDGFGFVITDENNDQPRVSFGVPELEAALDTMASISLQFTLDFFGSSGFSCNYADHFSTSALVRTDTDEICRNQGSSFDTRSQIFFDIFSDSTLEDDQLIFSNSGTIDIIEETCEDLSSYHPVAVAGGDEAVNEGDEVTLDGRGSYDVDDGIHFYNWIQTLGPVVQLTGASQAQAVFTSPQVTPGGQTLSFELTVTDYDGHLDRDSVQITVNDDDGLPEILGTLTGRMMDYLTDEPVSGVLVEAYERKPGDMAVSLIGSATTGNDGYFTITTLADGCRVEFSKNGFQNLQFKNIAVRSDTETSLGDILMLDNSHLGNEDISITLNDLLSGAGIRNATLELYPYIDGDALESVITDLNGTGVFTDMPAGAYFATAQASGHRKITFSVAAFDGAPLIIKSMEPKMDSLDEIRLVLSWGPSDLDLDSHLVAPTYAGDRFHLFYPYLNTSNPEGGNLSLERDDGPPGGIETILIKNLFPGTYTFQVHDYTNEDSQNSTALSLSGATVTVFRGFDETAHFSVSENMQGNLWEVLTIDGATGTITPVNTMGFHTVSEIMDMAGSYDTPFNVPAK